jgi:hypothetical protein
MIAILIYIFVIPMDDHHFGYKDKFEKFYKKKTLAMRFGTK